MGLWAYVIAMCKMDVGVGIKCMRVEIGPGVKSCDPCIISQCVKPRAPLHHQPDMLALGSLGS